LSTFPVTATWNSVLTNFFDATYGENIPEVIDPWTPSSDHRFVAYDIGEPCDYECYSGQPPEALCPPPSSVASAILDDMMHKADECPDGLGTSAEVACIDLWIAACSVPVVGQNVRTSGDCREADPNAPLSRSRAKFVLNLKTGELLYGDVNSSCWAQVTASAINTHLDPCHEALTLVNSDRFSYPQRNRYWIHNKSDGLKIGIDLVHSLLGAQYLPFQPHVNMAITFYRQPGGGYQIMKSGDGFPSVRIGLGDGQGGWRAEGATFMEGKWYHMWFPAKNVTCFGTLPPAL
jgi:hypothetical protein